MEEKENEAMMHVIAFDSFMKLVNRASIIDLCNVYQLPDLAEKFINKDDDSNFIQMLANYHGSEDDKWRVKKQKLLKIKITEDSFTFGEKKLFDAKIIYVVPKFNSIFVVPGERSIKEGSCSPVEAYQFTNLISTAPFLVRIVNIESPDGKVGLTGSGTLEGYSQGYPNVVT